MIWPQIAWVQSSVAINYVTGQSQANQGLGLGPFWSAHIENIIVHIRRLQSLKIFQEVLLVEVKTTCERIEIADAQHTK